MAGPPLYIGIGRQRRRGKDTLGEFIRWGLARDPRVHPYRASFADGVKSAAAAALGFSRDQLYGDSKDAPDSFWGFAPRFALQSIGQSLRDSIGEDVWAKALFRRSEEMQRDVSAKAALRFRESVASCAKHAGLTAPVRHDPRLVVIVTDMRHRNEAQLIRDSGGLLVLVERDIPHDPAIDDHPSETGLADWTDWDFEIDNNGGKSELQAAADTISTSIRASL